MTIRLQEVMRSDVEGGLSGPANPIPSQSIDCGCGQMQCPKLVKFATRKLFVGLICWIGVVQAASHAYFYVTGSTIARKFQINPYLMDWILVTADLTPFILGLIIAYWGDRIHRASWIGALTLLESVAYFILIIPHLTHRVHVTKDTPNDTHMSLYAEDSPELCASKVFGAIIVKENETCYFTIAVLITVLIISGASNIAYYALGISYLDDNTKKKHITDFIGIVIAVRIIGVLLGYLLGWGCLRIDTENLNVVKSYQDHIGAWWLGFPILSILLLVPGLLLSWYPRKLPSEVVEQAAASLLDRTNNRAPHRIYQKAGSPDFWPSFVRLITNKILICNILATVFYATAFLNFMTHEDIFLESRFHIARPTGMFLGFSDPLQSRLITNITKPVVIGLIVIISGLVLAKAKPRARFIVAYSFFAVLLSIVIMILLIFVTCDNPPIVGMEKGWDGMFKFCNRDCRCSRDAEFRPVCETVFGTYTYYNPCFAGCTTIIYVDNVKIYSDCSCVERDTEWNNDQVKDGPCDSLRCQAGWMLFQFGTCLAYALIASTFVGDLLINIRSVYKQDKAISIGFWMGCLAIFVNVPGKIFYEIVSHQACQYWGSERITCRFHNGETFGNYLCYLTIFFLSLCLVFKIIVWFFSKNLQLYGDVEGEAKKSAEVQELIEQPKTLEETETPTNNNTTTAQVEPIDVEPESISSPETTMPEENSPKEGEDSQKASLKYGPLGPGDQRVTTVDHPAKSNSQATILNLDSEDELDSSSDESKKRPSPQVAYTPLELDSDIESDLSSIGPRSRKRVSSKDYDHTHNQEDDSSSSKNSSIKRRFPNPDHYEDPRRSRNAKHKKQNGYMDGSRKTSSFEFRTKGQESDVLKQGDFNEVGIPIVDPFPDIIDGTNTAHSTDVKSLIDQYEQNASQETIDEDQLSVKSAENTKTRPENKIVSGIPLVAMVPSKQSSRRPSPATSSSSPDVQDKSPDQRLEKLSPKSPAKGGKPSYCTDF